MSKNDSKQMTNISHSLDTKRIAKNTIALYLRMGVVLILSLYITRVVLRSLGVEDYGIYNAVCGFVYLFSFLNATFSSSINRFFNHAIGLSDREKVTAIYNCACRIQVLFALLLFLVIEVIGVWYLNRYMVIPLSRLRTANWIFQFSLLSLLFTVVQTPFIAAVLAYERMGYYSIVSILDVVLKLIIAILISKTTIDRLWLYGILMMCISIINFLLYCIYAKVSFPLLKLKRGTDKTLFKSMLSFSGWFILNPIAYTGRSQGCNLILNYFFGPLLNAAYAISNQVASALDSFSMSISTSTRPQLIQSYSRGDVVQATNLFITSSKIMFTLIAMLVVPLLYNMSFILDIWLGAENVPEYAVSFCSLILLVKLVDSLNPSCTNLIMATGNIRLYMIVSFILILGIIPISILFFNYRDEPNLLFIIMLVFTFINQISSIIILHKEFSTVSVTYYLKDVFLKCILFFFVLVLILQISKTLLGFEGFTSILFDFLIVIATTGLCCFSFILNSKERNAIIRLFRKNR